MPNRIIKESICSSDSIDQLSWFEEVLFYRLIVSCDDYGRYDGRPAIIKNRLFPLKDNLTQKTVADAINKLASAELVTLYEVEGKPYLYLPSWNEHQTIRAKKSKFPSPDDGVKASEIICKQMHADASKCSRNPIQSNTKSNTNTNASIAHAHGEYGWVKLTDEQYQRLLTDLGQEELDRCIRYVDESAQKNRNKNKWSDWNLVIRNCHRDGWGRSQSKTKQYTTESQYKAPKKALTVNELESLVDRI